MKISLSRLSRQSGSTLAVTLVVSAIIGTMLMAYLGMVNDTNRAVARSQNWNHCIPVLEAGIEEAMTHINVNLMNWDRDGWYNWSNQRYKWRYMNGNWVYTSISNNMPPTLYAIGYVKVPLTDYTWIYRRVVVQTTNEYMFVKSMVAKGQIDMSGNNVATDSFDSTDPTFSTNGQYDPTKRRANGDVATNSGLINSLSVGNANIRGRVATGPGGSISVGSNGSVGSDAWHAANRRGVEPGYSTDDMNVSFPDIRAPFTSGLAPLPGSFNSTNYNYVLTGGNYAMSSINMSGQNKMVVTGHASLYVSGNISLTGNAFIEIAPGASLKIYAAGASTTLAGNGVINNTGQAVNFNYYGLPSNTSVSMTGNGGFKGTIYAPQAAFTLGGGGSNINDFIGSSVTSTVRMNGHFNFHYDESLGRTGPQRAFVITSWNEI